MAFSNFTLQINEFSVISFLIISLISYYFLFKEHHRRNELKFHEIYPRVISYIVLCVISFLVFLFGLDRVFTGYVYNDEIAEVIKEFVTGFAIISVVIINFIFYIKRNKVDLIQEEREAQDEKDSKIAEVIEIILCIIMFFLPLFNMFRYINYVDKTERLRQIIFGILFMITAVFLLFGLNPFDIRGKIKKIFKK